MSRILPLFFLLLITSSANSQVWESIATPAGGYIDAMTRIAPNHVLALQQFGGMYRSLDDGASWEFVTDTFAGISVFDMVTAPSGAVYIIAFQRLFHSNDMGATWTMRQLPFVPASIDFTQSGDLLVGAPGRLMLSDDFGASWTAIHPNPLVTFNLRCTVAPSGSWFAGGYRSGLYRSTDEGANWLRLDGSFPNGDVFSISSPTNSLVIVGVEGNTLRSVDDGQSWKETSGLDGLNTYGILLGGDNALYAVTNTGLSISTDDGSSWHSVDGYRNIGAIVATGQGMLASADGRLLHSTDAGTSWEASDAGMRVQNPGAILAVNSESSLLLAGYENSGLFVSTDNGTHWDLIESDLRYGYTVIDISASSTDRVAALTDDHRLLLRDEGNALWQSVALPPAPGTQIQALVARNDGVIILGDRLGVTRVSRDWGANWSVSGTIDAGVPSVAISDLRQDVLQSSMPLYAATDRGVFKSTNDGASWTEVTPEGIRRPYIKLAVEVTSQSTDRVVIAATEERVFRSTTAGASWELILETTIAEPIRDLFLTRLGHIVCLVGNKLISYIHDPLYPRKHSYALPDDVVSIGGLDLGGRVYVTTALHGIFRTTHNILDIRADTRVPTSVALEVYPTIIGTASTLGIEQATASFTLPHRSNVVVAVIDALGRMLRTQDHGIMDAASHSILLPTGDLPSGRYVVTILTETLTESRAIMSIR